MTRQDLFNEFCDVVFALMPSPEQAHDEVARDGVEALRQRFVAILDRVAMQVEADAVFTADDEADFALGQEREEADRG